MLNQLASFTKEKDSLLEEIRLLREQKGKERKTLALIDKSLKEGRDFVVELLWEEALTYQHSYMIKPEKSALQKMENSVKTAEYFIKKFELENNISRLERFLGRISDYKGNYKESIRHYKKALKHAKKDTVFITEGKPVWLEVEAFLAYSILMSGKVNEGLKMSKVVFERFEEAEGKNLKTRDYPTWAIWRTGIPVRTIKALVEGGQKFNKADMLTWLDRAESLIKKPVYSKKWKGKVNFSFRRDEIRQARKLLFG